MATLRSVVYAARRSADWYKDKKQMSEIIDRLVLVSRAVFEAASAAGGEIDDEFWRLLVRSQIEALRDPTPAMVAAAAGINSAEETWRVMVAAILL
jgi:hypothetical protein